MKNKKPIKICWKRVDEYDPYYGTIEPKYEGYFNGKKLFITKEFSIGSNTKRKEYKYAELRMYPSYDKGRDPSAYSNIKCAKEAARRFLKTMQELFTHTGRGSKA